MRNPPSSAGFFYSSPELTELRKRLDQPQRHALETASQKGDSGRDEEDADGLLDLTELCAQMARCADERADRRGGGNEGQTEAEAVDGKKSSAAGDQIPG